MTYKTLISSAYDGGCSVKITKSGSDSIVIENFYQEGTKIKAKYDETSGTIAIPSQLAYTSSDYGEMDLAVITSDALPDREATIQGQVNSDGTIEINSWWAIFVRSGDYANRFVTANYETILEISNGRLNFTASNGSKQSYNVIITQPYQNILSVKNFANGGLSCDIELYSGTAGTIATQTALQNNYGDWKTVGNVTERTDGITYDNSIAVTVDSNRQLSWTNWSMIATYNSSTYYYGLLTNTTLTTTSDIQLPTAISTGFQGDGTQASPYLINNASDLRLLASTVNNASANGSSPSTEGRGTYYKITADIDMGVYRFEPIGIDELHPFNGNIDGGGHTISNLSLIQPTGYTGLFGRATDYSTIANIKIDGAKVVSTSTVAGILVAYTEGGVSNCHVSNSYISNTKAGAGCLASLVQTITGCSSTNNTVVAQGGFGAGIAAQVDVKIADCHVEGANIECYGTSSGAPTGGLVATLYGATASDCSFNGKINGSYSEYGMLIGGIAGAASDGAKIERCISAAEIKGSGAEGMTGGLVGNLHGTIEDSHSAGIVNGLLSKATGGLTGYISTYKNAEGTVFQSSIKNTFTTAYVQAYTLAYDKTTEMRETLGVIGTGTAPQLSNVYYDSQITNFGSATGGATTAKLTSANGPEGFSNDAWTFSEGNYPALRNLSGKGINELASSAIVMVESDNLASVKTDATLNAAGATKFMLRLKGKDSETGANAKIANNKLVLNSIGQDTLSIINDEMSIHLPMNIAPLPYSGSGTADSPFLITNKEDLVNLGTMTNVAKQTFDNVYFKITADIDLENSEDFMGICSPSSTSSFCFGGTIDGGGHTIHNMNINGIAWTTEPENTDDGMGTPSASGSKNYIGFVGRLGTSGKIANLNIANDSKVIGYQYLGAIVGYNYGTIENCRNYADVIGYSGWVSGIMGYGTATSVVRNCYNAGNITTGYMNVGGIAGYSLGVIENCANAGNIAAKSISTFRKPGATTIVHAGGIVGNVGGAIITDVVNAGTVTAEYSQAGGISGLLAAKSSSLTSVGDNSIKNAINYGQVYSSKANLTGGIAGGSGTTGEITNCYWDSQTLPISGLGSESPAGTNGVGTTELTAGTAIEGFDSDKWQFDNGKYPILKQFADETKLNEARNIVINLPANSNVYSLKQDVTLPDGISYKLADGKIFQLSDGKLKVPTTVSQLSVDTLYAELGTYSKPILLKAIPAVALNGDGTKQNPYQLSTAQDWNTLAKHIADNNDELAGSYIIVMNDIDFSGTTFSPIAADGLNYFQASLDGNGKTIKGISYTASDGYSGCFGIIGKLGEVKNLTLEGSVSGSYLDLGGWVGKLYGTLEGCVNKLAVTSSRARVGGFAARTYSGSKLINCVNRGKISGSAESIGGVVAYAEEGSYFEKCGNEGEIYNSGTGNRTAGLVAISMPSTYISCYNSGKISLAKPEETTIVSGLIGLANGSANCGEFTLKDCVNNSDISCVSSAAGLVASVSTVEGYSRLKLTKCINNGNISTTSTTEQYTPTAGLLAYTAPGTTLSECINNGEITSECNGFCGGLVGMSAVMPTEANPVLITGCINNGKISTKYGPAAGITAMTGPYTTVEKCYNEGAVIGGQLVGGIVGYFSGSHSALKESWNIAPIECRLNSVGGLVGGANINDAQFSDSWNSGAVTCSNTIGGTESTSGYAVGGLVGIMAGKIQRCYNVGVVTGYSKVGGLVGMPIVNRTSIYDSYNAGVITAPADTCGGIIGVNPGYYKVWGANNVVSNTYYVGDAVTTNLASVGTAITKAELCKTKMGDGWTTTDDYTLPITETFANDDATAVYAVMIIPSDDESGETITKPFHVGTHGGVTWSSENSALGIDGQNVTFNASYKGSIIMKATVGKYSRTEAIEVDATTSLQDAIIDSENGDGNCYNLQGVRVNANSLTPGIYIVNGKKVMVK
jgi:hypothetical protein